MALLRPGLLEGSKVVLAGGGPAGVGDLLSSLGAAVNAFDEQDEDRALEWVKAAVPVHSVAWSSGGGLQEVEHGWTAIRAVAVGALIPAGAGRIVLLAPRPGEVAHAGAVRASLENLARTLSVEWARYGITTTAIWPGARTTEQEVATLVAYLCSPAGAYFSGCRFELDSVVR
jgi:NAD(P)-dependent dehydrogenase (short-subunit alcohol dehydrogenase family)